MGVIVAASSTINALTVTNGTTTNATSTNLTVSGTTRLSGLNCSTNANGGALTTDSNGFVSCSDDDSSAGGGAYPFPVAGNATSSLTQFNGGLTAYASSTITSLTVTNGTTTNATTTNLAFTGLTSGGLGVNANGGVYKAATTTYSTGLTYTNGVVTNSGVTSIVAGQNVAISGATGAVTINSVAPTTTLNYYNSLFRDWSVNAQGALVPTSTRGTIVSASSTVNANFVVSGRSFVGTSTNNYNETFVVASGTPSATYDSSARILSKHVLGINQNTNEIPFSVAGILHMTGTAATSSLSEHGVGVIGSVKDNVNAKHYLIGVEGKAEGVGYGSPVGVQAVAYWQGSTFNNRLNIGVSSDVKVTTDGTTALNEGVNVAYYAPPMTGGAATTRYSFWGSNILRNDASIEVKDSAGAKTLSLLNDGSNSYITSETGAGNLILRAPAGSYVALGTANGFLPLTEGAVLGIDGFRWNGSFTSLNANALATLSGGVLANASSTLTNLTVTNATTTNATSTNSTVSGTLRLSGLNCSGNTNGGALTTDANGYVSCSDDDGGAGGGTWATTSQDYYNSQFRAWNVVSGTLRPTTTIGVIVSASSTIGNGTQAGGLTISGGATTTGNIMVGSGTTVHSFDGTNRRVGVATSSPFTTLSVGGPAYIGGSLTATGTIQFTNISASTVIAVRESIDPSPEKATSPAPLEYCPKSTAVSESPDIAPV